MTVIDALNDLLEAAAEAGARRALELITTGKQSRLLPLKQCPIGYRNVLDLVRRGELKVFGVGNRKFVDREQLNTSRLRWKETPESADLTVDEVGVALGANEGFDEHDVAVLRSIEVSVVGRAASGGLPDPSYRIELE